jgi:excisionase family DNA binding protein
VATSLELLTVPEAARELRCSETQVRRLIHDKRIPYTLVGDRRYLFTRAQLDAYVLSQGVDPDELEAQAAALRAARERAAS